jgi:hypothetical protein
LGLKKFEDRESGTGNRDRCGGAGKNMRLLKTIVGVLLIPFTYAVAKAFYSEISSISILSGALHIMERGVLVYLLFHVLVFRPVYLYVLGHEAVHVLATWLCGGRVESFNVTKAGGSVITSKTNVFIELSPYFVPLYTIMLAPIYFIFQKVNPVLFSLNINAIFLFLVGLTLAMHVVMTSEVLKVQQSDIAKSGFILSFVIIILLNLLVTLLVFCPFFSTISFVEFFEKAKENSQEIYMYIYDRILDLVREVMAMVDKG